MRNNLDLLKYEIHVINSILNEKKTIQSLAHPDIVTVKYAVSNKSNPAKNNIRL